MKLGVFGLGLVGAFAVAAAIGASINPINVGASADHATMPSGAIESTEISGQGMSGLAMSSNGYRLVTSAHSVAANLSSTFEFRILRADGSLLTEFDVRNERRLHLIVLSRDLVAYSHLHPAMDLDGTWRVELPSLSPNSYRVYADFQPTGAQRITLATDIAVPGLVEYVAIPQPTRSIDVDGYSVTLTGDASRGESALGFGISRDGKSVVTEPYLGAAGHLVIVRVGDLGYLHAHAIDDAIKTVNFMAEFPTVGTYRMFFEFAHEGSVHMASFTVEISH